jgi:hypothetical protein
MIAVEETREFGARLRKALSKHKKDELLDALVELAEEDRGILRRLEARFDLMPPSEELVIATRQAIADATKFDEREINYNFDYDYRAYEEVKRNFVRLVELSQWPSLMELSLELMRKGSYQVEMSDEGMMTDEIVECLQVVIQALASAGLPSKEVAAWCAEMTFTDRVGFICDQELNALRKQADATAE